jgi:hypothetical protein
MNDSPKWWTTCHDHDQHHRAEDGCPVCNLVAERHTFTSRLAEVEAERDEARTERNAARAEVARFKRCIEQKGGSEHYPTQWAYNQACEAIDKHRARADALQREVEMLREALKPFADFASAIGFGALPENMEMTRGSRFAKRQVTAGDFRRAALASEQGEG